MGKTIVARIRIMAGIGYKRGPLALLRFLS